MAKDPMKNPTIRVIIASVITLIVYFMAKSTMWTIVAGVVSFGWAFWKKLKKMF